MVGNILVAHGMRKGNQNKALAEFIATLLKDEDYHYELAFLESDTQSLELTMDRMIRQGITKFKIVPLLIFSAMHYISDIPEILMNMQNKYPNISSRISEPLGTHPYMTTLVERRINNVQLPDDSNSAVAIIAHGNGSGRFTKAHDELKNFVKAIDSKQPVYARTLYGALTFRNDLEEISKQYDELIVVPLFFFDGRLVSKVKDLIGEMHIHCNLHITPSINFDDSLKLIIRERFRALNV